MPKITKQVAPKPKPKPKPRLRTGSVIERIGPLEVEDQGLRLSLYGRSGTGKTSLWASFPKPILAIICSGGKKPGELRSIDTPENRKVIDQVVLESSLEIFDLCEHVHKHGKYQTVVLDHATGLQDLVLAEVLGLEEAPPQLSWGLATQQQYGQIALQMKERLRKLLGLPAHVVIVAQEREFEPLTGAELTLTPNVGSALTPSITGWLNTAADYICQTFIRTKSVEVDVKIGNKIKREKRKVEGKEYCLRVGPDPVYTIKFRMPKREAYPDVIVNPDYSKIVQLIKNGAK